MQTVGDLFCATSSARCDATSAPASSSSSTTSPLLASIADRIVALDLGRVITTGEPSQVLTHPAVVTSYTGTPTNR
jgi:hypothetical protein